MIKFTLTIKEIRKETNDSITICFKQPGIRKIKYKPGQYLTLILRINGRKYARPYSFSSAPSVDAGLEITVKRVINGIVSNYINDELKEGDVVEVLEPMGDFIYESPYLGKSIFLWGVGSGITPLFSILKEALNTQRDMPIYLIYGNKNQESTIFNNQLKSLEKEYPTIFSLTNFYSQEVNPDESNTVQKGRISSEFVNSFIKKNSSVNASVHYICGPNGLKNSIKKSLLELEVPSSVIFIEEFELVIDPKEFEGVEDSKVTIEVQGQQTEIFVPKGKSILDVALDNNLEIPYSCQTGNCSSCKVKLKEGQLKIIGLTKKREDLGQQEFLLCCSYPLTCSISIEVI